MRKNIIACFACILAYCYGSEVIADVASTRGEDNLGYCGSTARYDTQYQKNSVCLYIKNRDMMVIEKDREEALKKGVLDDPKKVPAIFTYNEKKYNAAVRLKGDLLDHIEKMPYSLRVELVDGNFKGMTRFSLQKPSVRNYLVEPIYMNEAKQLGLLAPKYGFIRFELNGKSWGVVAYEEAMSKELLELNSYKNAPVLQFSDSDLWTFSINNGRDFVNPYDNLMLVDIKTFQSKKNKTDSRWLIQSEFAKSAMVDFQNKKLKIEDVFNIEKLYTAIALSDAWNTTHPVSWENIRFYLNPFTLKLDPIVYDNGHKPLASSKSINLNSMYSALALELKNRFDYKLMANVTKKVAQIDNNFYKNQMDIYKDDVIEFGKENDLNYENILNNKKTCLM